MHFPARSLLATSPIVKRQGILAAGVFEPTQKGSRLPDPPLWTAEGTCAISRFIGHLGAEVSNSANA